MSAQHVKPGRQARRLRQQRAANPPETPSQSTFTKGGWLYRTWRSTGATKVCYRESEDSEG